VVTIVMEVSWMVCVVEQEGLLLSKLSESCLLSWEPTGSVVPLFFF
jgi:hypothetical protein